jgi:propanol-preferring alcohol dehydrogenase
MLAFACPAPHAPLVGVERPMPVPGPAEVLIRVLACGVCRTDLHVQDGELTGIRYPIVPGHQAVGDVVSAGAGAVLAPGTRVGVPWLGWTCGDCLHCRHGRENLCERAVYTGCHRDGGFAQFMLADARYCLPLPANAPPAETTPLLCAGLIGYRALRFSGDAVTSPRIGIYGFGSAAHLVTQLARQQGREVLAFTRPGDTVAQQFARRLGAAWAGDSDQPSPQPLDAALIFAPVGALVPKALRDVRPGGIVICGGIHMSDIPSFPYADLWGERRLQSVANLTRQDGADLLAVAGSLRPEIVSYPPARANDALADLRRGAISGTAVLVMDHQA